jgi:hypothetical protein
MEADPQPICPFLIRVYSFSPLPMTATLTWTAASTYPRSSPDRLGPFAV